MGPDVALDERGNLLALVFSKGGFDRLKSGDRCQCCRIEESSGHRGPAGHARLLKLEDVLDGDESGHLADRVLVGKRTRGIRLVELSL
jgi:hypothetical protein